MPSVAGTLVPTDLGTILLALQKQVMTSLVFPIERVILWARDEESWHPQGDQIVRIRPRQQMPTPTVVGGGRYAPRFTRTINVALWCRFNVDSYDNDQLWLTDPTNGYLALELAVLNALFDYRVPDPNGAGMLCEPLKPGPVAQPSKDRKEPDWGRSEVDFDCTFLLNLPTSFV